MDKYEVLERILKECLGGLHAVDAVVNGIIEQCKEENVCGGEFNEN